MSLSATTAPTGTRPDRTVPRFGGFNRTFLFLEIRRLLRNRRTIIFALAFPVVFYLAFGLPNRGNSIGSVNGAAYIMVSLAAYGSMVANATGAAMVAVERAQGWSRQLRLTPLRPTAYVAVKILTAMVLGGMSVAIVFIVGAITGVKLGFGTWVLCGIAAWLISAVFAAFGLFIGYLVPSENAMQLMGGVLSLLALAGGLFVPISVWGSTFREFARWTPAYGLGEIARAPLHADTFDWIAVANVVIWGLLFFLAAMLLFRRDTKRV